MKCIQAWKDAKKERKQCYRTAAKLWRRTGSAALASVLLYKAATILLLAPLSHGIWALALLLSPSKFITTDQMKQLFLAPSLLAGIVLIALLNAFWNLYEFSILFHALQKGLRGEKCRIRSLFKESLLDIRHALRPRGWPILLLFLLPRFILEQKSFSEAAGESIGCVRKHFLSYTWMLFRYNARIAIRLGLIMLCYSTLSVAAALLIGRNSTELLTAIGTAQQRCTGVNRRICDMTYAEVRALDAGSCFAVKTTKKTTKRALLPQSPLCYFEK